MPIQQITTGIIANNAIVVADIADSTITGAKLAANTLANSVFQTGSVENYMNSQNMGFGMKNRIINGAMTIDQRNAGAAYTPTLSNQFCIDRWKSSVNPGSAYSMQRDSSANTVAGFTSSLKITSLAATTLTATQFELFGQAIEGYNIADLAWGTASAKPVTLSFWVKSSLTGTFGGALLNDDQNYNYAFSYTIVAANTWEYKTITITGPTGGTWYTNTSTGIKLFWALGCGSTYSVTPGSWGTATALSATGAVNLTGTNGATFYITGAQLEKGTTATPFEFRNFTNEFQLCQRYYCTTFPYGVVPASNSGSGMLGKGVTSAAAEPILNWTLPVQMRGTPTITTYNPSQAGSQFSNGSNTRVVNYDNTKVAVDMTGFTVSAGVQSYLALSADIEL